MMLAWLGEELRPTSDADLLGFGELTDVSLARILSEIIGEEVEPDAVEFIADSIRVEPIRLEDDYGGWRAILPARLGAARLTVQVDVGIGDVVTPGPVWLDYPSLLDQPHPRLKVYPRATVVAEKLHAIVLFGTRNTRMKDYFDLYALAGEGATSAAELAAAISATFTRRVTPVPSDIPAGMEDVFARDPTVQVQWQAFLGRNRLNAPPLPDVVAAIREFLAGPIRAARAKVERPS